MLVDFVVAEQSVHPVVQIAHYNSAVEVSNYLLKIACVFDIAQRFEWSTFPNQLKLLCIGYLLCGWGRLTIRLGFGKNLQ